MERRLHETPVFLVLCALALGACKREARCYGALSNDDLLDLQERIADGKDPCPGLLRPAVKADESLVTVNGRRVAEGGSVALDDKGHIPALYEELRRNREVWKQTHPGEPFVAAPELEISTWMPGELAAAVLQSAARAGYPDSTVRFGTRRLALRWWVPGPPDAEGAAYEFLFVHQVDGPGYSIWRETSGSDARIGEQRAASLAEIPDALTRACSPPADRCADALAIRTRGDFNAVLLLIDTAMQAPALRARPPCVAWDRPFGAK